MYRKSAKSAPQIEIDVQPAEGETIVKIARPNDFKNYSNVDFKSVSQQKKKINSIYGKVLHHSMQADEKIEFNPNHAVFNGYVEAYKNHRPITISPDIIWLLIVQAFANHVNNNAEELRSMFVNFDGKQELRVIRHGITPETASTEDWNGIFAEFVQQISGFTGQEVTKTLEPEFTTTTTISKAVGQLSIMAAMKEYFDYHVVMCICVFPFIVVEGSVEDWEKIIAKLEGLRKYKLDSYVDRCTPILAKIVDTKRGNVDREFWGNMIHIVPAEGCYDPGYVDGWFINFFLYDIYGHEVKDRIYDDSDDLTSEMLTIPFKLTVDSGIQSTDFDCEILAGFVGTTQIDRNKSIKPVIHWLIRFEDKEEKERERKKIEEKMRKAQMEYDVVIKKSKNFKGNLKNTHDFDDDL